MRLGAIALVILVGCGDDGATAGSVTASVSVPISTSNGTGPSYLEKYVGKTVEFEIAFDDFAVNLSESPGCGDTTVYTALATRTASGPTGADFMTDILDQVQPWELTLEICDTPTSSSVALVGAVDAINTSFGCNVPDALQHRDADGHPHFQSFTATQCNAIILDVVAAYSVGNQGFSVTIHTGSAIP